MTDQDESVQRDGTDLKHEGHWAPGEWERINGLLQEAIALPADERPSFLDRVCASAGERQKLERLLELHERGADFLESGVGPIAAELFGQEAYGLAPGDQFGPYRVVRPLDRGGMGVVYLGHDTRLDRPVAIKLLPPEYAGDLRHRERLRREAQAAASVSHPGVAHVYAFEEDAQGATFIVSEYVDGHTLRAEIAKGPLPPALAVRTAVQIARAVGAAHARRIVHRDLKPENVMRSDGGDIKVLDFGLALSLSARTRLTVTGTLLGTLGYMSPEQLAGQEATRASDVFALGLVLHELAAGAHAFAGPHPASYLTRVVEHEPNALPPQVLAAVPGLDEVVRRCLEKPPERRYGSMDEVVVALERLDTPRPFVGIQAGSGSGPVGSSESPLGARGLRWWQIHQAVISVFYGLALVPLWFVRPAFASLERGGIHAGLFVLAVVAMAVATSVRLNLAFIARVQPWQLAPTRARTRPLVRASDWLMSLSLLAAGAVVFVAGRPELAALLAGLAVFTTVSFLVIEPGTESGVFSAGEGTADS